MKPIPGKKAPVLSLDLVDGGHWDLSKSAPSRFTLLVFYRGLHCPVCKDYLAELAERLPSFLQRGVATVAVSMDDENRAQETKRSWPTGSLDIAYGMSATTARNWGLYISKSIKDDEPEVFSEPGLALVDANGDLYFHFIQSVPFARPKLQDVLGAIDTIEELDYPARGKAA